ncbi:MAG: Uma2 family endonuclease [Chloroflexaceae bacterium]
MPVETSPEELIIPPEVQSWVDDLVTEDDTPVDNIFSAKQQRLLVEPLYSSWAGGAEQRAFIADANVGLFVTRDQPPLVPDGFLSLGVTLPTNIWLKQHRSYFFWLYGKPPEVVIEVVSNRKGGELDKKLREYAQMRIFYYVVFDPEEQLRAGRLRLFILQSAEYREIAVPRFPEVELGLTLWQGEYEKFEAVWLRWCDMDGNLIPTGDERARQVEQQVRLEAAARQIAEERVRTEAAARRIAEERVRTEAEARQTAEGRLSAAEAEMARLRAELERLRGTTDEPDAQ